MNKHKVLIVDDSAVVRQVISDVIASDRQLEVMAAVADPIFAMKRMERQWPDVIVLDVEMPRMDGISFLRKIMADRPTPIVMCSTLTQKGTETAMEAMAAGAVEVVAKPSLGGKEGLRSSANSDLLEAIHVAVKAKLHRVKSKPAPMLQKAQKRLSADAILSYRPGEAMRQTTEGIVAIGTSTGGTQALQEILTRLPRISPGIVIVQHMPEMFTAAFAERLNGICEIEVREAKNGDRVLPGRALIAPGGKHMLLNRSGSQYFCEIKDGPLVSRHRPSVDVLFRSVARYAGKNALGIIMTGMGDDGAAGMEEMHRTGAKTVAQDEASCVVYGMPKEAVKRGAVDTVVSLDGLPQVINAFRDGCQVKGVDAEACLVGECGNDI
jgi:two-component system chemotaxis response regulator CheB